MTSIDNLLDDFAESPDAVIDLTDSKTFAVAGVIAILLGCMIGIGYLVVFNSVDCTLTAAGKVACMPNLFAEHKLEVLIVTLVVGILTGMSPYFIKQTLKTKKQMESEDEIPFEEHHK